MANPVSTATTPVQGTALAGSNTAATVADFNPISMFWAADWGVKCVMIALLLMLIWCVVIIIEKRLMVKTALSRAASFERDFWHSDALDKFYDKVKKRASHPMSVVFLAAMDEWNRSRANATSAGGGGLRASVKERINNAMTVARNREIERLENGLSFLAITSSSAPFIGLFGTVWGIMHSFHSIALSKNTSLTAVAPGISEALLATAIGLAAAIPAYIAYNKYTRDISSFAGRLEDFSLEFQTILSRQTEG